QVGSRHTDAVVWQRERHRIDETVLSEGTPTAQQIDGVVRDVLAAGVREGLWAQEHVLAARMTFWSLMYYHPRWFHPDGPRTAADLAEDFADTLLGGLLQPARAAAPKARGAKRAPAQAPAARPGRTSRVTTRPSARR